MKDIVIIILLLLITINTFFTPDYNSKLSNIYQRLYDIYKLGDIYQRLYDIYDELCKIYSELKKLNKE